MPRRTDARLPLGAEVTFRRGGSVTLGRVVGWHEPTRRYRVRIEPTGEERLYPFEQIDAAIRLEPYARPLPAHRHAGEAARDHLRHPMVRKALQRIAGSERALS